MKMRLFPFLFAALLLLLSGCAADLESQPKSTPLSGSEVAQTALASEPVYDTNQDDEFQIFIKTWNLTGLIPEGLKMTAEDQS